MLSRDTFSTASGVQLSALWSFVETCPSSRTFGGSSFPSQPLPPSRNDRSGASSAARTKNSATRASRSGSRLPRKARSHANRSSGGTGWCVSGSSAL